MFPRSMFTLPQFCTAFYLVQDYFPDDERPGAPLAQGVAGVVAKPLVPPYLLINILLI